MDGCAVLVLCVVSYRNSTSNHNPPKRKAFVPMLYLIEILHQTTTMPRRVLLHGRCILSKFYIKPQPWADYAAQGARCILSKFYIKPQPDYCERYQHRRCILSKFYIKPQLTRPVKSSSWGCILSKFYIKPQPADNGTSTVSVVSYRNSTSNHNKDGSLSAKEALYLIEILHQTTTKSAAINRINGCILSKFYIKPQQT